MGTGLLTRTRSADLDRPGQLRAVRGDQDRLLLQADGVPRQLGGRRRLTGALQAGEHHLGDAVRGEADRRVRRPHEGLELVVADLDEVLGRRGPVLLALPRDDDPDDLPERLLAHAGGEVAHHAEVHVRLEQRGANVPQRAVDGRLVEGPQALQALAGRAEATGQGLEHGGLR